MRSLRGRGAAGDGRAECRCRDDRRSSSVLASISATSSSRTATSTATGSMSQPGSKVWPNPAESAFPAGARPDARQAALPSTTSASSRLKNIARPVRVYRVRARCRRRTPVAASCSRASLPDKPSIAVLPFQNMSGDPEQEYFADGMVEEIITALSPHSLALRHRPQFELHLQGPSRRPEAGRPRAGRALRARRLGAKGRQSGAHHGQLIDAATGAHLGPTASTARWKMSSSFRIRLHRASPALSSRHCKPPRSAIGRPADRRPDRL